MDLKETAKNRTVLNIKKNVEGGILKVDLIGRLDAVTSIDLDEELKDSLDGVKRIVFDLEKLNYIASAGLRVLLKYQKFAEKNILKMEIKNIQAEVREVFDMTGFSDFLNIVDKNVKKLSIDF